MRLINKSISALALASMMGLWSCSQDEMLPGGETSLKGHSVPVTLTVSRGEAQTRTILSENTETGGLNDEWEENDVLHVYGGAESQNYGQKIGTLRLVEKIEPNVGVFTGELTLEEGEQSVSIWYHGDSENSDLLNIKENGYNRQELWVDLSNQNFKSVEALSAVDILSKTVTLKNYGDKVSVVKDEIMDAKLAMARFSLTGLPTGAVGTLKFQNIKQISSNIYDENRITYDNSTLGHMEFAFPERAITKDSYKKPITVENVKAGDDVYVAFLPGEYQLSVEFTNAADKAVYKYDFTASTNLEAGVFYCTFTPGESDNDGIIDGVEIPLVKVGTPLSKWAETNLERVSGTEYYKGQFAASYTDNGHYYQFGRNIGLINDTEASMVAYIYSSNSDISFGNGNGNSYPSWRYYDANNVKQDQRPMGFMIPCTANANDWWPARSNRNDNWDARATASGYTPSDLYVINGVKWKIPSVADYEEILPSKKQITSALTSYEEVKTIGKEKYAFRWKKVIEGGAYYLQIKARNINSDSEASKVDWDAAVQTGIDTRYFKAAGFIYPLYFVNNVYSKILDIKYERVWNQYYGWQDQPVSALIEYVWEEDYAKGYEFHGMMEAAKAMPAGHYGYSDIESVWANIIRQPNGDMTTEDMVDVTLSCNVDYSKYVGTYWTADASRNVLQFIFDDDKQVGVDGIYICDSDASACSIRLIKAE